MSSPRRDQPVVWPGGPSLQGPHRVGSFAICPQLEAWAHDLHLRPVLEKPAPAIGTLIHAGLAYRYAAMLPQRPEWFVYADGYQAIQELAANPEFREIALRVFAAYEEFYRVNRWTPVLVEHQFIVHFANGEPYSARTDLLAIENGEYVLIDHKSVGRLSSSIGARYASDRQMLTGLALARACGYDIRRVVINALTREMPYPSFQRYDVPINSVAFSRLGVDTEYYLSRMAEVRRSHPDPRSRPRNWDGCTTKFNDGLCDYYRLCTTDGGFEDFHVPEEHLHGRLKKGS